MLQNIHAASVKMRQRSSKAPGHAVLSHGQQHLRPLNDPSEKGGKAQEVMVETGTRTSKDIVVLKGLTPGDTVLTTGVLTLKNDAPVKVSVTPKK